MENRESEETGSKISRPIVIIGAPRSGTTLLFRCLAVHPLVWHLPAESHAILEGPLHPSRLDADSNRCTAEHYNEGLGRMLRAQFCQSSVNLNRVFPDPRFVFSSRSLVGRALSRAGLLGLGLISRLGRRPPIRLLEKTPKNSLRVSFLARLFPDAHFVWLRRHPLHNIDSLVAGWYAEDRFGPFHRRRFAQAGYPVARRLGLQDYDREYWKFALVPGWRGLEGATVADAAVWQYYQCNRLALRDFESIDSSRVHPLRFESFLKRPVRGIRRILSWAGLPKDPTALAFARELPKVNTVGASDATRSGLRRPDQVLRAIEDLPELRDLSAQLGYRHPSEEVT